MLALCATSPGNAAAVIVQRFEIGPPGDRALPFVGDIVLKAAALNGSAVESGAVKYALLNDAHIGYAALKGTALDGSVVFRNAQHLDLLDHAAGLIAQQRERTAFNDAAIQIAQLNEGVVGKVPAIDDAGIAQSTGNGNAGGI